MSEKEMKEEAKTETKTETKKEVKTAKKEVGFTKNQILTSRKYMKYRDILQGKLDEGKTYTHTEILAEIEKFKKGGA